ncbi:hypothetical protein M9Y10_037446 [Tritrichomonas musculus]|uniref:VWFA domain-containing protein n=1 Tax=Tritrichomonas musculus TaxID=1915356 RepID=A0ABR2GSN5_9EUKA
MFPGMPPFDEIYGVYCKAEKYDRNPVFKDLKDKLFKTPCAMEAYSDYYNEENFEDKDYKDVAENPKDNAEMYIANCFKGQKILIVMLYNCGFNPQESSLVDKKYLSISTDKDSELCVKKAVEFFGIDIVVVEDYDAAMDELTKDDEKGNSIYYACWVIIGWNYPIIPNDKDANNIIPFTECLKKFWRNGGAVVMLAEGEPFYVQTNYFLERISVVDKKDDGTREAFIETKLRLHNNHKGGETLIGTENLQNPGTFYHTKNLYGTRSSLSHNLKKLFEGETISYVDNNPDKYKPFIPFMRGSEGGISALFYPANPEKQTGDIIIDCCYTKFFTQISANGTFQYIQNIAVFTAQFENSISYYHVKPHEYRPSRVIFDKTPYKGISFPYDELPTEIEEKEFDANVKNMKTLFAVDYSWSIENDSYYHRTLEKNFNEFYNEERGDVIFLWESKAKFIDYPEIKRIWKNQLGHDGTYPIAFLQLIRHECNSSSKFELPDQLIIITDGAIDECDIQGCVPYIHDNEILFKVVDTFIVGTVDNNCSVGTIFQKEEEVPTRIFIYNPNNENPNEPEVTDLMLPKDIRTFKKN